MAATFFQLHRRRCAERDAVGRRAAQSHGQRGTPWHQRRPAEAGEHRCLGRQLSASQRERPLSETELIM